MAEGFLFVKNASQENEGGGNRFRGLMQVLEKTRIGFWLRDD